MDSEAVDLQQFTSMPFVIERPAEPSLLADQAAGLLAKAGWRMSFGNRKAVADIAHAELASVLPADLAVVQRQSGSITARTATPSAIIASSERPDTTLTGRAAKAALVMDGFRMAGHSVMGSDRRNAAVFATMLAFQRNYDRKAVDEFVERQRNWDGPSRSASGMAATLGALVAHRDRLVSDAAFPTKGFVHLASLARSFAEGRDADASLIFASLGPAEGRPSSPHQVPQLGSLPALGDLGPPEPKFKVREYGSAEIGPNYLPAALFNAKSMQMVQGVHPDLVKVMIRAREISKVKFEIVPGTGGVRDKEMQAHLKAGGHSHAKLGRHTIGYAIDLVPVNSKGNIDFSDQEGFLAIRDAMELAANELGVPVEWGGGWKKLVDKPHFELDRKIYPGPDEKPDPTAVMTAFR